MAKYDANWVRSHYDAYAEKEWARWDVSAVERVKFLVHLHYLEKYVQPGQRVLEIGAGPGRFTRELARITPHIVVADISPVQLRLNQQNGASMGFAGAVERWVEADICNLQPHFQDAEFDAVVCYGGPLSYVFERQEEALQELLRVTRPGGLLFLSVMSLWGTIHHFLPGVFKVDSALNRQIVATGDLGPEQSAASAHFCHMYRAAELRSLVERAGAVVEVLSASDCLAATWSEFLGALPQDGAEWQLLLEMELEACREPGCADMGTHMIAVVRKR